MSSRNISADAPVFVEPAPRRRLAVYQERLFTAHESFMADIRGRARVSADDAGAKPARMPTSTMYALE